MDELLKCAWCQKEPKPVEDYGVEHNCNVITTQRYCYTIATWQKEQREILAARAKDFNAGRWGQENIEGFEYADFEEYLKATE